MAGVMMAVGYNGRRRRRMRHGCLIYNPAAGRFAAGPLLSRAVRVLTESGWEIDVLEPGGAKELVDIADDAAQGAYEAVFVAGGDGSVGQVAGRLANTDTALGVLPAGTANVWAQEMGIPRLDWIHIFALEEAARALAVGQVRQVDLGMVNGKPFLLWAGIGLDAQIVNSVEPRDRWERALAMVHYVTMGVWTSIGWEGLDLKVRAGNQTYEGHFLVAVASNIRSYAGGLIELAPNALIDDGLLDFWLIEGRSIVDAVYRLSQILLGSHVDAAGVTHFQTNRAAFEIEGDLKFQIDGEPAVMPSPAVFEVHPKVLKVLVPRENHRFSENIG
jgi:diacylglycerol kinase (ATP)